MSRNPPQESSSPGVSQSRKTARRSACGRPAAALAWGLAAFVLLQTGLAAVLEVVPSVRDPEFGLRDLGLRRQLNQNTGRPLVVVLGSSRVSLGLSPGTIAAPAGDAKTPIIFNHSLVGSGPIMELLCLDRILAQHIQPDLILIEFWPAFFQDEGEDAEERRIDVNRLSHRDLRVVSRYSNRRPSLFRAWLQSQLLPCWSHRFILLSHYAPGWLPWSAREDSKWNGLDGHGWLPFQELMTESQHKERIRKGEEYYALRLQAARLSVKSDQAVHEIVARCRRKDINVALLYMPEATVFRSLYPPSLRDRVEAYLGQLRRKLGLPTIDARGWIADEDFTDGFHLMPRGARSFTLRLSREVIQPMLERKRASSRLAMR